jgi:hypothetical protein
MDERVDVDAREAALERLRRDSGLSLDSEGTLLYRGAPVENERVVNLFHRGLSVRHDGAVTLTVGRWWCYVAADGPAHVIERFEHRADGSRVARLRGGAELGLAGAALAYVGERGRFVAWLEELGGPALLARTAHQAALAALMREGEAWLEAGGHGRIWLDSLGLPCALIEAAPGPAAPRPAALDPALA